MGRAFAPFTIASHFAKRRTNDEIQRDADKFYRNAIESALADAALTPAQKCDLLARLAALHDAG